MTYTILMIIGTLAALVFTLMHILSSAAIWKNTKSKLYLTTVVLQVGILVSLSVIFVFLVKGLDHV